MGTPREDVRRLGGAAHARRAAFKTEYLDFERGIRVGHLEPEERITRLIKARLRERHGIDFICDRWGRGVYWQWICWVPAPNRRAKPLSAGRNFGSVKFFASIEREERVFQAGMQLERAPTAPGPDDWQIKVERDWDWHVLRAALKKPEFPRVCARLLREGFRIDAGAHPEPARFTRANWDPRKLARRLDGLGPRDWGVLQLYFPMTAAEVAATSGNDLIDAIAAVYEELIPAMNLCMYAPCLAAEKAAVAAPRSKR
ncbi:MAG TPA: hypothetical protein PKX48_03325 [Planctomycetota bacterium]|jgi:hypothetical protein|nr:hypothetical protein [Planctomycetota bacterium]OQC19683.1 MAG: hypothetical protein BWX69_02514 [Planctomycetes bacterium ADurb.Bin069]NMD35866.1 hypothetical protein [Planctomycetota bacterium]HNR97892.1 hypothetical protein [Planctomycetota bacterium]HNU24581.1 hypothetical protein [Planctomycetota bacterium]